MRNIVICCDGTRGRYQAEEKNTNVVRFYERLAKDGADQISYYDPGVGTYSPFRGVIMGMADKLAASISGHGITSEGIDENIRQAYRYLMNYYEPDDRVFLFGYSRGAHTVRVLAGMLHKCGLLTKGSDNLIPSMVGIYRKRDNEKVARGFRESFSRVCKPHFIGVWDTVASVGWLSRRQFSNETLNPDVANGYQALAMDERRHHFRVSRWDDRKIHEGQTIEQVWFLGSHGDVGGQDADRGISDITLKWMLGHARDKKLLLRGDWQAGLCPDYSGEIKRSDRHFWRLRARDRFIPGGAKIHRTVLLRRDDPNMRYQPRNLPRSYAEIEWGPDSGDSDEDSGSMRDANESSSAGPQPGTPEHGVFVEQYKLMAQSADNASSRRVNINQYQTTLNLGIIALYGVNEVIEVPPVFLVIIAAAGIAVSVTWLLTIRSLEQLNRAKFDVILAMEKRLTEAIFKREWASLKGGESWTYQGAAAFEKMVPPVFTLVHIGVLAYALVPIGSHERSMIPYRSSARRTAMPALKTYRLFIGHAWAVQRGLQPAGRNAERRQVLQMDGLQRAGGQSQGCRRRRVA